MCHQVFPKSEFYKRKDRNGEFGWTMSYCGKCDVIKVKKSRDKNPEHYRDYNREYNYNHFNTIMKIKINIKYIIKDHIIKNFLLKNK